MTLLLRKKKLGRRSCHGIRRQAAHTLVVARNDVRNARGYPENEDTIIRWGCTDVVPDRFRVIQTARAIQGVGDKTGFRRTLLEGGEELAPRTWFNYRDDGLMIHTSFANAMERESLEVPVIVRPRHHAQGRQLFVCRTSAEVQDACRRCGTGYYISELINKSAEYRMFIVQGRCAAVAQKTPGNPDDVAWNVAQGGRFDNVRFDQWPLQAVRKSIEAFNLSDLVFGGVDMMIDQEGRAYVIEINSAPSLPLKSDGEPTYRQTAMAKCFDWFLDRGTDRIPLVDRRGGYRKFIHPAMCDNAELVEV